MPEVQMPRLSDTMTEGVLSRWLKAEGDIVHKGDVLAEIETDKATMDLEAYDEGPLTALLVAEGTTVPIGQPIAVIGASTGGTSTPEASRPAASPAPQAPEAPAHRAAPESGSPAGRYRATPLVRKIARDHGIDLGTVTGTGPHQRIIRADIEPIVAVLGKATGAPNAKPGPSTAPSTSPAPAPVATAGDETIPLTRIRRVTAQRLTESAAVPHFYLTGVVDAERLLALRADINAALTGSDERVSVTDLLVRACAVALRAHPLLNSSWAGDSILRHGGIHIGVAVATEAGLVVPVVRDADRKGVREIATDARSLAERAHAGTLSLQELSGGTFTISNLGMYGVDHFTAIINPPEAAILAVGAATPTPVARDGEVVVRSVMKMTLSVDHRVVDGAPAAAFLRELIGVVEAPLRIVV
jgi:pyruvate dehydrogenase E2 component (dihydrolipoamide acetyltransferase)